MHILKIEIEAFGRLTGFSMEPARGITLIEGPNESGKSTILAFLRFALYGFPRKNAPDGDERDKRLSWQTHTAAGRLTLEWQGETYRITRRCVSRSTAARESVSEELSVVKLPEGREVPLEGKTPGEYFLGLPCELYDGSLSLVQSGADRVCAGGMGEAVGELLFSDEAVFSAEAAEARLQAARRALRHAKGRGGRMAELEDQLGALDSALVTAKEERARIAALQEEMAEQRTQLEEKKKELGYIAGAFERADIDRTLALFEDLRGAREEERCCRLVLEQIGTEGATHVLEKEQIVHLTEVTDRMSIAQQEIVQLVPEVERLRGVRHSEKLLQGAARIAEMGDDAEKVPERVAKQAKKAKARGVLSVICLLLGGVALGGAYLLPAYALWLGSGGIGLLALSVIWLCGSIGARRKNKRMLKLFGTSDATMFRTYLEQCKREGASYEAHTARVSELQAKLANATDRYEQARVELRTALAACGQEQMEFSEEHIREYLIQAAKQRSELQAQLSAANIAYERAVSAREVLAKRVEGTDEETLRARRAAIACTQGDFERLHERRAALEREIAELEENYAANGRRESALLAVAKDPSELSEQRRNLSEELCEATQRFSAIVMATEALTEATEEMRRQITPRLSARASALFAELTDGIHGDTLRVADDLSMTLEGEGIPRPLSHFSAGCRDIAHLSLRLALLETVTGDRLPLFFDEALSRLDDGRAEQLLRVLERYAAGGGQCLLFTCHGREDRMLSDESALRVRL